MSDFPSSIGLGDVAPFRGISAADLQSLHRRPGPWTLPDQHEQAFQRDMMMSPEYRDWFRAFNLRFGSQPDLNDPEYNYRLAWALGVRPEPYAPDGGFPHWPSVAPARPPFTEGPALKSGAHPTRWMEEFMQRYGVDPNDASPDVLVRALQDRVVPLPGLEVAPRAIGLDGQR